LSFSRCAKLAAELGCVEVSGIDGPLQSDCLGEAVRLHADVVLALAGDFAQLGQAGDHAGPVADQPRLDPGLQPVGDVALRIISQAQPGLQPGCVGLDDVVILADGAGALRRAGIGPAMREVPGVAPGVEGLLVAGRRDVQRLAGGQL